MRSKNFLSRGFTLHELTAAVAVIGISASLAVPGFNSLVNDSRRAAAINDLVASMHVARSEAVKRNEPVTVCTSAGGERCDHSAWHDGWIAFTDPNQDRQPGEGEFILDRGPGAGQVKIESEHFAHDFVYRPDGHIMVGNPAENTGDFTFCDARGAPAARIVIVPVSGQPRLSERRLDGSAPSCSKG